MSKVIIQKETTKNPITLIGKEAGICYGTDTTDDEKNYKRGLQCIKDGHGRTLEFPQVYMILDGYSARFGRQFYTHIGGSPTRLQASTRYIDYTKRFDYVLPEPLLKNKEAEIAYKKTMRMIQESVEELIESGVDKEDAQMLLPLGMSTKIVCRTNARNLMDMSKHRLCNRAYWEYRKFMRDLITALSNYSEEWATLCKMCFKSICDDIGYCPEKNSCGRKSKKK